MFHKKISLYHDKGFTLAEVLIALVVIGVIAAITLPIISSAGQERAMSMRQVNIVRKITNATDQMRTAGELTQFDTTMDFVNVLKKYLKITKICDSNHIAECWPTKTVIDQNGDEYIVANAKTRGDLGFKANLGVPNVGVVLADGASLIMTYDPKHKGLTLGDKLTSTNIGLPVGDGKTEIFNYTTNSTSGLDFVFDVNGSKGPNSETIDNKMHDIRNLRNAHFGDGCTIIDGGKCWFFNNAIEPVNCQDVNSPDVQYCGSYQGLPRGGGFRPSTTDYWAGANKYCTENGGTLPTQNEIENFLHKHSTSNIAMGYYKSDGKFSVYGWFWTTHALSNFEYNYAAVVGAMSDTFRSTQHERSKHSDNMVLCMSN